MKKKSKSKATGGLNVGEGKQLSAMPSSNEVSTHKRASQIISDMSENSPNPPSQIGFQPTQALGEVDEVTANVQVLTAFATKLTTLVEWKRLELADGREVIALCFPLEIWRISPNGVLVVKQKAS